MKHSTPFGRARQARPGGAVRGFGKIVAIIERLKIGGTCVNAGCVSTKTMVAIAHTVHVARCGAEYGFAAIGLWKLDNCALNFRLLLG